MRWFFLWLAAAASIILSVTLLYLGPAIPLAGKGGPWGLPMPTLPLLMLAGIVGIACSIAGVWWSQSRLPAGAIAAEATSSVGRMKEKSRRAADAAAGPGVILAITAVASVIFFSVGVWLVPWSNWGAPGLAGIIPFVGFASWPVALGATLISWPAVVLGTGRRQTALRGLILGSLALIFLPSWFLLALFGFFGGD